MEEEIARANDQAAVRTALTRLPPEHQVVLRLYYFEQWSVRRIAVHLSVPVATVKWRLHRGRHLLRERLTLHGASLAAFDELAGASGGRRLSEDSRLVLGLRRLEAGAGRRRPVPLGVPRRLRRIAFRMSATGY
jgi:hypothetical protein